MIGTYVPHDRPASRTYRNHVSPRPEKTSPTLKLPVDSDRSLANRTRNAPAATEKMPSHRTGCGMVKPKWNGLPFFGCQTMLTSVLMIGARPKIKGAMYSL